MAGRVSINVEKGKNGKREIVQYDAHSGREIRTGLKVSERELYETVKKLAATHNRAGNQVNFMEQ